MSQLPALPATVADPHPSARLSSHHHGHRGAGSHRGAIVARHAERSFDQWLDPREQRRLRQRQQPTGESRTPPGDNPEPASASWSRPSVATVLKPGPAASTPASSDVSSPDAGEPVAAANESLTGTGSGDLRTAAGLPAAGVPTTLLPVAGATTTTPAEFSPPETGESPSSGRQIVPGQGKDLSTAADERNAAGETPTESAVSAAPTSASSPAEKVKGEETDVLAAGAEAETLAAIPPKREKVAVRSVADGKPPVAASLVKTQTVAKEDAVGGKEPAGTGAAQGSASMPFLASTTEPSARAGAARRTFGVDGRGVVADPDAAGLDKVENFRLPSPSESAERWKESPSFHVPSPAPEKVGATLPAVAPASSSSSSPAGAAAASSRAGEASALLLKAWENVEALRSSANAAGRNQLEIQLDLGGDAAVTLKLRLTDGQVQTTLRTDSVKLRQALEQNWGQFSQRAQDSGLRVAELRFEAPPTAAFPHAATDGAASQGGGQQQPPPRREQTSALDDAGPRLSFSRPSAPPPSPTTHRRISLSATNRAWQAWA